MVCLVAESQFRVALNLLSFLSSSLSLSYLTIAYHKIQGVHCLHKEGGGTDDINPLRAMSGLNPAEQRALVGEKQQTF